ncbi:UDP-2,3-diacylglucosamine diphosphatase [Candidatus Symbiothrix dinenymphae]|uniref:UDP-2,3-diacylglucosamine diphosphatase n=1 Tax=Candidatus Symbiothrix dinenymphae TaxID=467085 RepID=UPI0007024FB3|nr:UDP-2,3-diacylglucosamine diphosphatase [Candidatus Symbiothrix dinenymphae]
MKKTYFASDVHLGSDLFGPPVEREKQFVRWLDTIKADAEALYLLGDIFDFWFEYKKVVPRGFTRFLGKLCELHDQGIEIHYFTGNHDMWLSGYLANETGVIIHTQPLATTIGGKQFYLAHGDGLGDNSLAFRIMSKVFHNKFFKFLYSNLLPTHIGIGFGSAWARSSRQKDLKNPTPYLGENKEHLMTYSKKHLNEHPETDYLIFGHRHIMLDFPLSPHSRILILGDWMRYFSYAEFNGEKLELKQFKTPPF